MRKGGKGGAKTISGLKFEKRVSLKTLISSIPGYSIQKDAVYFEGNKVAQLYQKHSLYKNLLEPNNVDYSKIISKKLLPDDAILVTKNNTLFIVEIKFQEVSGSVDEKLQTCDFKNKQYQRLLSPLNLRVKYVYVLNDWFKDDKYRDVLDYIRSVGCDYFFNVLPFDFLGLPTPTG
ncbi:MAG: hypothetical protein RX318_06305 [bacterium]|nr:hypothetical protein [bacterium]